MTCCHHGCEHELFVVTPSLRQVPEDPPAAGTGAGGLLPPQYHQLRPQADLPHRVSGSCCSHHLQSCVCVYLYVPWAESYRQPRLGSLI